MTTGDAPFAYLRDLSGQVGTRAQYLGLDDDPTGHDSTVHPDVINAAHEDALHDAGEHGPDADLRRAHDEHPCRCAHHRETTEEQR